MKTTIKSILIILIEIFAAAALCFACIQLFPGKDEVTVEEFVDIGDGNMGGTSEASVDDTEKVDETEDDEAADAEDASSEETAE